MYELTVAPGGSKLKEPAETGTGPGRLLTIPQKGSVRMTAKSAPILALVTALPSQLGGFAVVDKTGLSGNYDFDVEFANSLADAATDEFSARSLFSALRQDLGLELKKTSGRFDVIVIDRADKSPVEN